MVSNIVRYIHKTNRDEETDQRIVEIRGEGAEEGFVQGLPVLLFPSRKG